MDIGVSIIIGVAFSTIVKSLVDDIIMPPIGEGTGGVDFSSIVIPLNWGIPTLAAARQAGAPTMNIGSTSSSHLRRVHGDQDHESDAPQAGGGA
jgi:large conductance mechanosensitive channel